MRVAVVGSGVSGLAATWLLNEYSDHEVHLYEASDRPGGHANTVRFNSENASVDVDTSVHLLILWRSLLADVVSSGFVGVSSFEFFTTHLSQIVFNPRTYPNFLRFLQLHPPQEDGIPKSPPWSLSMFSSSPPLFIKAPTRGIRILPTQMTFSVSRDNGAFEWAGKNPLTVFCQPWRIFDPSMWRMLYDIVRFNACSLQLLKRPTKRSPNIGRYLKEEGYSDAFKDNYLIVCYLNDSG